MNVKKLFGVVLILLLIWFVVQQPSQAAGSVESIAGTLERWAGNITTFFTQVVT